MRPLTTPSSRPAAGRRFARARNITKLKTLVVASTICLLLSVASYVAASAVIGPSFLARKSSGTSSCSLSTIVPSGGAAASPPKSVTVGATKSSSAVVVGLKNTLASGLAAACSKTILAPFDTIKTVQQHVVQGGKPLGLIETARRITSRPGGIVNLYSGLGVAALGSMPSVGLYFGVYSYCKRTLGPKLVATFGSGLERENDNGGRKPKTPLCSDQALRTVSIALSAVIGNTVASFSRVPYEVVKQKLQTGQFSSTLNAIVTMWGEGGMRAFFPLGGVSIQMVRDIPYAVITLLSYEYVRENWVVKQSTDDPNNRWLRDMAAGGISGGIGSYLTNPLDVLKTRLQTDADASIYGGSIAKCARSVLAEGGPRTFLRGSVPRLMHKIPANAAFFGFYELFRRILNVD